MYKSLGQVVSAKKLACSNALARVGEVDGARVAASLARQRSRRANSAVAARLARLARRLAALVLVRAAGAGRASWLQPLLGRNARGLRRDALGEYTLLLCH